MRYTCFFFVCFIYFIFMLLKYIWKLMFRLRWAMTRTHPEVIATGPQLTDDFDVCNSALVQVMPTIIGYPFPLWWLREYTLCLIIIIESEVWTIIHCLGLGHETVACAVCLYILIGLVGASREQAITCISVDLDLRCNMASPGQNELKTYFPVITTLRNLLICFCIEWLFF